jgi:hypothetical protein
VPSEGGRWLVTLAGYGRDYPPTDEAGFLAFARSLRSPVVYDAIASAEPLGPISGFRRTKNRRADRRARLLPGALPAQPAAQPAGGPAPDRRADARHLGRPGPLPRARAGRAGPAAGAERPRRPPAGRQPLGSGRPPRARHRAPPRLPARDPVPRPSPTRSRHPGPTPPLPTRPRREPRNTPSSGSGGEAPVGSRGEAPVGVQGAKPPWKRHGRAKPWPKAARVGTEHSLIRAPGAGDRALH